MGLPQFRLIVITDTQQCVRPLVEQLRLAAQGGQFTVILRDKHLPWNSRLSLATEIAQFLPDVIVSDPLTPVPAAHLSTNFGLAMPRPDMVGCSVHLGEKVPDDVDYVLYSPIFTSKSKPGYGPALGLSGLYEFCESSPVPVWALGGIENTERVTAAILHGAAGVAVMGQIMRAEEPGNIIAQFNEALALITAFYIPYALLNLTKLYLTGFICGKS